MQIKNRYIILAIVILLIFAFCGGAFTYSQHAKSRISEFTEQISSLTRELDTTRTFYQTTIDQLEQAEIDVGKSTGTISNIEESNVDITKENQSITEGLQDLGEGVSGDSEILGEVINRLEYYLEYSGETISR